MKPFIQDTIRFIDNRLDETVHTRYDKVIDIYELTHQDVSGLFAFIRFSSDIGTPISSSIN